MKLFNKKQKEDKEKSETEIGSRVVKKKMSNSTKIKIAICSLLVLVIIIGGYGVIVYNNYQKTVKNMNKQNLPKATQITNIEQTPFTMLFIGLGTNGDDGEATLADSINMITVNPQRNFAEVIAIPRDSYLPFGELCEWGVGSHDKITHSTGVSPECLETTLESVFDVNIDYFVSVNFRGFVQIVDALGGVEMEVPDLREKFNEYPGDPSDGMRLDPELKNGEQWCEHDSARNPFAICFSQFGKHKVSGEQALALARSRHYDGDYSRSLRQTELIKAIVEKATSLSGVFSVNSLLSAAGDTIETNIPGEQFMDFANLAKTMLAAKDDNSATGFTMRTTQLAGTTAHFQGERITSANLDYSVVPAASVEDIREKLKSVLGNGDVVLSPGNFDFDADPNASSSRFSYDETIDKRGLENVRRYE